MQIPNTNSENLGLYLLAASSLAGYEVLVVEVIRRSDLAWYLLPDADPEQIASECNALWNALSVNDSRHVDLEAALAARLLLVCEGTRLDGAVTDLLERIGRRKGGAHTWLQAFARRLLVRIPHDDTIDGAPPSLTGFGGDAVFANDDAPAQGEEHAAAANDNGFSKAA